jgi:hypothetical protein
MCGRTVLAMNCALAGAQTHLGRPLNRIVRRHAMSGWIAIIVGFFLGALLAFPATALVCQLSSIEAAGACGHNAAGLVALVFPFCWAFCAFLLYRLIRATEKEAQNAKRHDV